MKTFCVVIFSKHCLEKFLQKKIIVYVRKMTRCELTVCS